MSDKKDAFAWNKAIQEMAGYPKDEPLSDRILNMKIEELKGFNYGTDESPNWDIELLLDFINQHIEAQDTKTAAAVNAEWVEWVNEILTEVDKAIDYPISVGKIFAKFVERRKEKGL